MNAAPRVTLIDLVGALSRAMDLISPAVVNHHVRVGFLAVRIGAILGYDAVWQRDLLVAGLMHDAGAFSLSSKLDALQFEADATAHAEAGYHLIRTVPRLETVARLVRHHHTHFEKMSRFADALPESGIIALADRIDVLIRRQKPVEDQSESILRIITAARGTMFNPEYVDALLPLAESEGFWAAMQNPGRHLHTLTRERLENEELGLDEILRFSRLFSLIIDFRSRFTATHSRGVAEVAVQLARLAGFTETEQTMMRIAGNLHDLGKLAVPSDILEKECALEEEEFAVIKKHALHSHRVLVGVPGMEVINDWASSHHERVDGRGYPFNRGATELSLGARIVAVADVFTAITEDRPYRSGMDREQAVAVLRDMAGADALDDVVVELLVTNFDEIDTLRERSQEEALREFRSFGGGEVPERREC